MYLLKNIWKGQKIPFQKKVFPSQETHNTPQKKKNEQGTFLHNHFKECNFAGKVVNLVKQLK